MGSVGCFGQIENVKRQSIIKDEEIGNKEFKITITDGAKTIELAFVFIERFERVYYDNTSLKI